MLRPATEYFKSGATALTLELLFLALVYAAVWAVRKWVISAKTQKRGVVTPRFAIDDGSREDMKGFRQIENLVGEVKIEGEEEMV